MSYGTSTCRPVGDTSSITHLFFLTSNPNPKPQTPNPNSQFVVDHTKRVNQPNDKTKIMPSQVMHYTRYQSNRPTTALGCTRSSNSMGRTGSASMNIHVTSQNAHLSANKFRSEFPNLPGFSKFSTLRPQSPKVSRTSRTKHFSEC